MTGIHCRQRCSDPEYRSAPLNGRPPSHPPAGSYGEYKRCRHCHVWLQWAGARCPCCSHRLGLAPRPAIARGHRRYVVKRKEAAAQ